MPRSSLPQNYIINSGTLWQDFEGDLSDWVKGANGTKEANTSNYLTGAQSMRLTTPVGGSVGVSKTISPSVSLQEGAKHIRFSFLPESSTLANLQAITINLCADATPTKYAQWSIGGSAGHYTNAWNTYARHISNWTLSGGMLWSDPIVKIQIYVQSKTDLQIVVNFDSFYYGIEQLPRCLITFDDNRDSVYTEGFSYMEPLGISGTVYTIPTLVGNSGRLTLAQMTEMYTAGWAMANHTYNHWTDPYLVGHTQAEVKAELIQARDWLIDNGFPRAANYVAYPGGVYDDNVLAAMTATGMLTGRTTSNFQDFPPIPDYRLIHSTDLTSAVTLASAKTTVDNMIKWGGSLAFHTHQLLETAGTSAWAIADFQALMDYLVARQVKCVTIDKWYKGLTNPRTLVER